MVLETRLGTEKGRLDGEFPAIEWAVSPTAPVQALAAGDGAAAFGVPADRPQRLKRAAAAAEAALQPPLATIAFHPTPTHRQLPTMRSPTPPGPRISTLLAPLSLGLSITLSVTLCTLAPRHRGRQRPGYL